MSKYLYCLLFIATSTCAQILDVEKFKLEEDTSKAFYGNIALGITSKQQIDNVLVASFKTNAVYLTKNHAFMQVSNINVLQNETTQLLNDGYVHLRGNLFRKLRISPELFLQYQYDYGRNMESRYLAGATGRLLVLQKNKWNLSVNTGAMYEKETWLNVEDKRIKVPNENWKSTSALRIVYRVSDTFVIRSVNFYQAKWDDFFSPRIANELNLKFKVTQYLSFVMEYGSLYDFDPVIDIPNYTYVFVNRLTIDF